jgi:hypothetical protein
MILPRQFWELYSECQIIFTVKAGRRSAPDILRNLKRTSTWAEADAQQQGAGAVGRARANAFDVSNTYLPLGIPAEMGDARFGLPKCVRVVMEAKLGENLVRMSVAVPFDNEAFKEMHETRFRDAVSAICCGRHEVRVEAVADKPRDFRGGGWPV